MNHHLHSPDANREFAASLYAASEVLHATLAATHASLVQAWAVVQSPPATEKRSTKNEIAETTD
jgi:hypothetical protein